MKPPPHLRLPLSLFTLTLILLTLTSNVHAEVAKTSAEFKAEGDKALRLQDFVGASRAYGKAVELDPTSFRLHLSLAQTQLSLSRHSAALQSFSKLLELQPSYYQAHLWRGKIYAKEGEFEKAREEVGKWEEGSGGGEGEEEGKELKTSLPNAIRHQKQAHSSLTSKSYPACIEHASAALQVGPNSLDLRQVRLQCYEGVGDLEGYIGDLSRLANLQPSIPTHSIRLAYIYYFLHSNPTQALSYIKQALHYDPDSKEHKKLHKQIRKLDKEVTRARNFVEGNRFRDAVKILTSSGEDKLIQQIFDALDSAVKEHHIPSTFNPKQSSQLILELNKLACTSLVKLQLSNHAEMEKHCEAVLSAEGGEEYVDALVGRGDVLMKKEEWDQAAAVYEKAFNTSGRSSQEILDKVNKARGRAKQAKSKDYYKVLGIPRDADKKTIRKAFNKLAKENHPDHGGSQEKMSQINEAYEVLSDPELRERFDNGDDPNDQQGGGGPGYGNPFGGFPGGHPFGQQFSGGQHFQFHHGGGWARGGRG